MERESELSQTFNMFIEDTRQLIENIENSTLEDAAVLYGLYKSVATLATKHIGEIDTEIRVQLCAEQDKILERIIDFAPTYKDLNVNRVFTPAVHNFRHWNNVELLKDKGLTGYLLAKEFNAEPYLMFCTEGINYHYSDLLPGLNMLYTDKEKGNMMVYFEHLHYKHSEIDALILHGMYDGTMKYLDFYREYRPDGKVYCGLDLNGYWMSRISWNSPEVKRFAGKCDVIATSCRSLRDKLNRNPDVNFGCRFLPNGFYNPTNIKIVSEADYKENVILTVGRIGTEQKNNHELMMAFAEIADLIPDWELRFVGGIEPEFNEVIEKFFSIFPALRERIKFTGPISDKAELFDEYAKAKIFVLTSILEGGTPNVYAEALVHGCMFITSDIDAAEDITNYGELGKIYTLGNLYGLCTAIVETVQKADKDAFRKHIPKALAYAHKYFDWERNAKKLAYMLCG